MREEKIDSSSGGLTYRNQQEKLSSTTTTTTTTASSIADNEPLSPQISNHTNDAGNQPNDHYKARLSPFRYKMRSLLLPLIREETAILAKMQSAIRCPLFDFYFAWTANLASHTFYVLMLPPPAWFGGSHLTRDLVHVLGLGIYFTGFLKDYFCLPRPRSPPLHRITMSSYTTEEYGFPSSHLANATGVSLLVLLRILNNDSLSATTYYSLIAGLAVYYVSLIFGRLYCGMHGFLDVIVGGTVGSALALFRHFYGEQWDALLFGSGLGMVLTSVLIITMYVLLIHVHSEPVDDCPCFDDSVAFIGVIIGLDLAHMVGYRTGYFAVTNPQGDPYLVPYDYQSGVINHALRFLLGVLLVITWKAVSKPVVYTILPPIYKFVGVYLPRRNYISTAHTKTPTKKIRSTSISNDVGIGDLNSFIKGVTDHSKRDEVGPDTDIDYYEMMSYNEKNKGTPEEPPKAATPAGSESPRPVPPVRKSGVFKYRYDVEIVGRLIVYAGIAITSVWTFAFASAYLNL
ncbi:Dihydrosphingosine 1-phosphate phosphatase LCB3 [Candida viswanathii]|uniref:Dihydrosphingosine 1-phosphate phosphatase LCB3 n=1 Tax=Candida viswanathii TaxID=5486 RepID=A0A367Y3T3_9ASCO|nr:Dihydrosphingosine 1-phosphate phosphatase LCB3 [Candida viswanathii]